MMIALTALIIELTEFAIVSHIKIIPCPIAAIIDGINPIIAVIIAVMPDMIIAPLVEGIKV